MTSLQQLIKAVEELEVAESVATSVREISSELKAVYNAAHLALNTDSGLAPREAAFTCIEPGDLIITERSRRVEVEECFFEVNSDLFVRGIDSFGEACEVRPNDANSVYKLLWRREKELTEMSRDELIALVTQLRGET